MKRALTIAFVLSALAVPANGATTVAPGFTCRVLAQRQPLAGTPNVDVRVVKLTFAPGRIGDLHRHRYGEILYLLSGSGTNTSENGTVTALSVDRALVIGPNAYHKLTPTGKSALTVLSVQFPQRHAASYEGRPAVPDQCKP